MARLRHLGLQLFSLSRLLRPTLCALQAQPACHFHEPDKKSGYRTPQKRVSKRNIKKGMGMIMPELHKLKQEYIDRVKFKNLADFIPFEDGDYEIQWQLDNEEAVADWVFTCDGDNKEGKSSGEFVLGPNKTGIFRGYLNTSLPGDGHTVRAGYCSIRSPQTKRSFQRVHTYQWEPYTHLMMRLRGDGRPYQVAFSMYSHLDLEMHDMYSYPLYTRGGPYWQIAKIPFSKFILSAKGRIQDHQRPIDQNNILCMVITLGDDVSGPFHLEIDYVGLYYDANHTEVFEYEMYDVDAAHLY